jgi:hypothetical protein
MRLITVAITILITPTLYAQWKTVEVGPLRVEQINGSKLTIMSKDKHTRDMLIEAYRTNPPKRKTLVHVNPQIQKTLLAEYKDHDAVYLKESDVDNFITMICGGSGRSTGITSGGIPVPYGANQPPIMGVSIPQACPS